MSGYKRRIPGGRRRLAVALGALLTILTAWAGVFAPYRYSPLGLAGENGGRIWQIDRDTSPLRTSVQYWWMQVSGQSMMIPQDDFDSQAIDLDSLDPAYRPDSLDDLVMLEWYRTFGFPVRALRCEVHWVTQRSSVVTWRCDGGVIVHEAPNGNVLALPLRPISLGFAANTVFYSVLSWLLIGVIARLARRLRARRPELCPHCRYDRSGLVGDPPCPECGVVSPK